MNNTQQLYDNIAYRTSALVTRTYSTSFSIAVRMLAPEQRKAIYSIYGFVRFADEIVDTFLESNQKELLDNFERDMRDAFTHKISMNPVLHAFVATVNQFNIPQSHINAFLESMHADLIKHKYSSDEETKDYIHGSAEVVGLMCLKIFLNGNEGDYRELKLAAMKLGSAFQKVNFLRDLKADQEILHRTYFADLARGTLTEEIKDKLIYEVEQEFAEAKIGIKKLPGRSRLAVLVAYLYYTQLLRNLKRTSAERIVNERIRVSSRRKIILLINAMIVYKLNMV